MNKTNTLPIPLSCFATLLCMAAESVAHPVTVPHSHSTTSIEWELDSVEDGNSAHNHMMSRSFGGNGNMREPYSADGCWDQSTWRTSNASVFAQGHCYVDSGLFQSDVVTYYIIGLPSAAEDRVRDAFDEWNSIATPFSNFVQHGKNGNTIGLVFEEVSSPPANITVLWQDINDLAGGGAWSDTFNTLEFDSSYDWDYANSPSTVDNSKSHFLSVALHEVGHAVGLVHQLDIGQDVMAPPVGLPGAAGTRNLWFEVDADSIRGVAELYGIPQPPPPPPASISWGNNNFVYCHLPQCALWDMRASGGAGASHFEIRRSFSLTGHYATIQTETDISYFNVHGSDQNLYWKVCGINSAGETCSPAYRTRIECEQGAPPSY